MASPQSVQSVQSSLKDETTSVLAPVNDEKKKEKKKGGGCCGRRKMPEGLDERQQAELLIKKKFRDLVIYLFYVIILMLITLVMTSINFYVFTMEMQKLFVEKSGYTYQRTIDFKTRQGAVAFDDITTVKDFWKFAKGPLLSGLYWTRWYNYVKDPTYKPGSLLNKFDNDTMGRILYENKLLGPPRIRQIRVKKGSCKVNEDMEDLVQSCYGDYEEDIVDKEGFPKKNSSSYGDNNPWVYRSAAELGGWMFWGSYRYEAGGYAMDLHQTSARATYTQLLELENDLWIRRGTRAVFIEFATYNPNVNLFCVIVLCVEFPATGGARPLSAFSTVKLIRYHTTLDMFVLACEIVFMVFVLYYIVEEVLEIIQDRWRHFLIWWNILDIILIIMAILCMATNIYRVMKVNEKIAYYKENPEKFQNFYYIAQVETFFGIMLAVMAFMAWVKVFKYISFNKTMTQLSSTLSRCAKDLLGFFIMFFIVFIAFTQLGYLLFGPQVEDFSTFVQSFFTLFRIILGDFDFAQLERANRILGPTFFMMFVFFVFFVLINMFLAIINDTYSEVKSDMSKQVDVYIMSDFFKERYQKVAGKFSSNKEKLEGFEKVLQEGDKDGKLDYEAWKVQLLKQGYDEEEIEAVFAKYDVDGDRALDATEQKKMLAELERQKSLLKEKDGQEGGSVDNIAEKKKDEDTSDEVDQVIVKENMTMDEFMSLTRRVDRMEGTMRGIIGNIDRVLTKLANLKF